MSLVEFQLPAVHPRNKKFIHFIWEFGYWWERERGYKMFLVIKKGNIIDLIRKEKNNLLNLLRSLVRMNFLFVTFITVFYDNCSISFLVIVIKCIGMYKYIWSTENQKTFETGIDLLIPDTSWPKYFYNICRSVYLSKVWLANHMISHDC